MPAASTRIGLREIRAMAPQATIFDGGSGSVPGFGARRRAGPHISYFVMYRTLDGRLRRYTIGTHGAPWTPETARIKAQQVLMAAKIDGADPQAEKKARRAAATVAELCDMYLEDAEAGRLLTRRGIAKKASTVATDRSRIDTHIRPLLGTMKVPSVTRIRTAGKWSPDLYALKRPSQEANEPKAATPTTPMPPMPTGTEPGWEAVL
jgi:hypothetical protein